jgi:hypothetical protein
VAREVKTERTEVIEPGAESYTPTGFKRADRYIELAMREGLIVEVRHQLYTVTWNDNPYEDVEVKVRIPVPRKQDSMLAALYRMDLLVLRFSKEVANGVVPKLWAADQFRSTSTDDLLKGKYPSDIRIRVALETMGENARYDWSR